MLKLGTKTRVDKHLHQIEFRVSCEFRADNKGDENNEMFCSSQMIPQQRQRDSEAVRSPDEITESTETRTSSCRDTSRASGSNSSLKSSLNPSRTGHHVAYVRLITPREVNGGTTRTGDNKNEMCLSSLLFDVVR